MISTPRNPTTVADQRRARTISPRNRAAPMVANRGEVKLSDTASASGIIDSARNQLSIATSPVAARQA